MMQVNKELDTSGLSCPLPILRLRQTLNEMLPGERLRIIATDPGSKLDFSAFANQTGHRLLEMSEEAGRFIYVMEKA